MAEVIDCVDKKPIKPQRDDPAYVRVNVWAQDGSTAWMRIERDAQLQDLIDFYCASEAIDKTMYRFFFNDACIRPWMTPDEVGLTNGDQIKCFAAPTKRGTPKKRGEEKKPAGSDGSTYINLNVWNQDNSEVRIWIKRDAKLQKLMDIYYARRPKGEHGKMYRFFFDGVRIRGWQTIDEVGLSDGDQIDAMSEQGGGTC